MVCSKLCYHELKLRCKCIHIFFIYFTQLTIFNINNKLNKYLDEV